MKTNQVIQKAFNAGYLLEKHLPQLSKVLVKGFQSSEHPYVQGFVAGSGEMSKERSQNKSRFLDRLKDNFGSKPQGKTKDRGDREMDIEI